MQANGNAEKPSVTIVTAIEPGVLETEVPLMVSTLRRFGGRLADCPVIAVSPRWFGLSLMPETRRRLDDLGVRLIERDVRHRFGWWGFMNKPTGLVLAAPHIATRDVLWLDGDILVASPPDDLSGYPDVDVLAAVEELGPTSTGPENRFDPFWDHLARVVGLESADRLPWVTRPFSRARVRVYFNSGVFRYPRGSGLEDAYLRTVEQVLDAKTLPKDDPNIFLMEQISFGLAVARLGLRFHELDEVYNFQADNGYEECCPPSKYPDVKLFHYHRTLRGGFREEFLRRLRGTHPELAEMVESYRPIAPQGLTKYYRKLRNRLHYRKAARNSARFNEACATV